MSWDLEIKNTIEKAGGSVGEDVSIGQYCVITNPGEVHLANRTRIDPFCLITTALDMKSNSQICSHVILTGGNQHKITLGEFTFVSYGSKFFCGSDKHDDGLVAAYFVKGNVEHGDIVLEDFSGVGADVILMPGVRLPEGATIGAKSFVDKKKPLTPWGIHYGMPLKFIRLRDETKIKANSHDLEFMKRLHQ